MYDDMMMSDSRLLTLSRGNLICIPFVGVALAFHRRDSVRIIANRIIPFSLFLFLFLFPIPSILRLMACRLAVAALQAPPWTSTLRCPSRT